MQEYHSFVREIRAAIAPFGKPLIGPEIDTGLSPSQVKRRRGRNFMTNELIEYLALPGCGFGPVTVEIAHGVCMGDRLIGVTVFHKRPENEPLDFDQSQAVFSVTELSERLSALSGQE